MKKIIFGIGLALALAGCMKPAAPAASGAHAGMDCCAMKDGKMAHADMKDGKMDAACADMKDAKMACADMKDGKCADMKACAEKMKSASTAAPAAAATATPAPAK